MTRYELDNREVMEALNTDVPEILQDTPEFNHDELDIERDDYEGLALSECDPFIGGF